MDQSNRQSADPNGQNALMTDETLKFATHSIMKRGPSLHGLHVTDELRSGEEIAAEIASKVCITDSGCEQWTGQISGGYGVVLAGWRQTPRRKRRQVYRLVHRVYWEQQRGPVPRSLCLDHVCRNRACRNLSHLEIVTLNENVRRGLAGLVQREKTHCHQGHEFTEANTYLVPRYGWRNCKMCLKEARIRNRAKAKEIQR